MVAHVVAIDVRLQSAMTDFGHRSLCLFFNYVDPAHFYYVHFGKEADPHANQIFLVSYPKGESRRLTNDLSSYTGLAVAPDGRSSRCPSRPQ